MKSYVFSAHRSFYIDAIEHETVKEHMTELDTFLDYMNKRILSYREKTLYRKHNFVEEAIKRRTKTNKDKEQKTSEETGSGGQKKNKNKNKNKRNNKKTAGEQLPNTS